MALKDRLRRFTRSDRSSSTSSRSNSTSLTQATTVPTAPLQKSSSRLNLSKTLTAFSHSHSHKKSSSKNTDSYIERDPESERRAIEEWRKRDEAEWKMPSARRPGRKSQKHQDVLRAFEWGRKSGEGGRCGSVWSGVSPGTSRVGSMDDGGTVGRILSRESAGGRNGSVAVGTVVEE